MSLFAEIYRKVYRLWLTLKFKTLVKYREMKIILKRRQSMTSINDVP